MKLYLKEISDENIQVGTDAKEYLPNYCQSDGKDIVLDYCLAVDSPWEYSKWDDISLFSENDDNSNFLLLDVVPVPVKRKREDVVESVKKKPKMGYGSPKKKNKENEKISLLLSIPPEIFEKMLDDISFSLKSLQCVCKRLYSVIDNMDWKLLFFKRWSHISQIRKEQLLLSLNQNKSWKSTYFTQIKRDKRLTSANVLFLDKAWHCIHFIISGSTQKGDPHLSWLLCGINPVFDYHLVTSAQTREFYNAISTISTEDFLSKFNPNSSDFPVNELMGLRTWRKSDVNYLLFHFKSLKQFLKNMVERRKGFVTYRGY